MKFNTGRLEIWNNILKNNKQQPRGITARHIFCRDTFNKVFIHTLKKLDHIVRNNQQHQGKNCSVAFIWMVTLFRILSIESNVRTTLYSITKSATGKNCPVALNGHILAFHLQTQKLEPPNLCIA